MATAALCRTDTGSHVRMSASSSTIFGFWKLTHSDMLDLARTAFFSPLKNGHAQVVKSNLSIGGNFLYVCDFSLTVVPLLLACSTSMLLSGRTLGDHLDCSTTWTHTAAFVAANAQATKKEKRRSIVYWLARDDDRCLPEWIWHAGKLALCVRYRVRRCYWLNVDFNQPLTQGELPSSSVPIMISVIARTVQVA